MSTVVEISLPPISAEELERMWETGARDTLTLLGRNYQEEIAYVEPLFLPRRPRPGETVDCKPVTFTVTHPACDAYACRADFVDGESVQQSFQVIRMVEGDTITCSWSFHNPLPRGRFLGWLRK